MLDFRPGETPSWQIDLFQDDAETLPLNCTSATLAIVASDLPFTPAIAWLDRPAGRCVLSMTSGQTAGLERRKRYWLRLRLELPGPEVIIPADLALLVK